MVCGIGLTPCLSDRGVTHISEVTYTEGTLHQDTLDVPSGYLT